MAVRDLLDGLVDRYSIDLVAANAENAAGGFGITSDTAQDLFDSGVHVLTTGNHVWDKKESLALLEESDHILRPANYPPGTPGKGVCTVTTPGGTDVAIINLSGRIFMDCVDCPFRKADELLDGLPESVRCVLVDFHAEATSEKRAFSLYLDGRAGAVVGTHTHIPTADERILPYGTAYITDVGMTGNEDGSVIGIDYGAARYRFLTQMPVRFDLAKGVPVLNGALIELLADTGKAVGIQRVSLSLDRTVSP
ncbi:MAG: TIGR00282 family metallophosphoesterase [bacterium]|nr:MAG: TIGR00282 family metallophosphoesterase [bacterium]